MNETVNVSIAGLSFRMEEATYTLLDIYLRKIRIHYASTPEGNEILEDIEARIAEIILSRQPAGTVVGREIIEYAIDQLSTPEDIAEAGGDTTPSDQRPQIPEAETRPFASAPQEGSLHLTRRFYRDTENRKIAGVCSGLASYFHADTVLIRFLFVAPLLLTILFGIFGNHWLTHKMALFIPTAIIIYFLLWVLIPKAITPRQKLEMQGETITRSKIEESLRRDLRADSIADDNLRAKKERNASILADLISVLGRLAVFCLKAIVIFIGFWITVGLITAVSAATVFIIKLSSTGLVDHPGSFGIGILFALLTILIPVLLIAYLLARLVFNISSKKRLAQTFLAIWFIVLAFGTVFFYRNIDVFSDQIVNEYGYRITRNGSRNRGLRIEKVNRNDDSSSEKWFTTTEPVSLTRDTLYVLPLDTESDREKLNFPVKIRYGDHHFENPTIVINKKCKNYGTGRIDDSAIERIEVVYRFVGDTLFIQPFTLDNEDLHNEKVDFNLYLPETTEVIVHEKIDYNEYLTR